MERDGFGFHFTIFDVHFVAAQHDGYVLAHAHKILVPGGHVFVCDARCDVEHDDGALALDVVAVAQAAKLLLARRVPHVKCDRAAIRREAQRMHFDAQRGHILLLEFACQVSLDKGGLADATIANKYKLFT